MKLSLALALLAAAVPSVVSSGIIAPRPGAYFQAKETFLFSFDPSTANTGAYTTNVTVSLHPQSLNVLFPLGVLDSAPWEARLTLPAVATGRYELVALEQLAWPASGLPYKTIRHTQALVIEPRPQ